MNKSDIINKLAESLKVSKSDVLRFYDAHWLLLEKTLKKGEPVSIRGFGTFKKKDKPARTAVNPKTREKIKVPKRSIVTFSPGKSLKNF